MLCRGTTSVSAKTGPDGCEGTGEICWRRRTAQTCKLMAPALLIMCVSTLVSF